MTGFFSVFTVELLNSGIRLATPVILAALGGALCNKAGVLNLALESMMLMGAFVGIVSAYFVGNSYIGLLIAMASGGLLGLVFAFLYHKYDVDLVILAIAFNLIIQELTVYVMRVMFGNVGSWSDPSINRIPDIEIPLIKDIPVLGNILSGYNIIVYFSWAVTIVMYLVLYKMKFGRQHPRGRREPGSRRNRGYQRRAHPNHGPDHLRRTFRPGRGVLIHRPFEVVHP